MAPENKLSVAKMVGLIAIALVLIYIPYKMIAEHQQDNVANSYYHDGRQNRKTIS